MKVFKTSRTSPAVDMRKNYADPMFKEMDLIEYDITRETHQVRFFEMLEALTLPVYGKGLDKVGRMVLFLYDHRGKVIIYQNGQTLSSIYDNEQTQAAVSTILDNMRK
jgi:hypothetical protein